MLKMTKQQMDEMALSKLMDKLDRAFSRDIPDFAEASDAEKAEYLKLSVNAALSKGFITEQGIASYALAVWWLGLDFERHSEALSRLLASDYPEVRRVHAMNEWVEEAIGHPDDIPAADAKLKLALEVTRAWGD